MNSGEQQQNRAWVVAWRERGAALEQIREQELRALTEEEAGRWFAEMAFDTEMVWISPERAEASGFVE